MRLELFGLEAWVENAEGQALNEYKVMKTDTNTIECWIPSQVGTTFSIKYSKIGVRTQKGHLLSSTTYLDEERICQGTVSSAKLVNGARFGIQGVTVGPNEYMPFEFKTRDFTEGEPTIQDCSIKLRFEWGKSVSVGPKLKRTKTLTKRSKSVASAADTDLVEPKRKIINFKGHVDAAGLGAPRERYPAGTQKEVGKMSGKIGRKISVRMGGKVIMSGKARKVDRKVGRKVASGRFEAIAKLGTGVFIFRYGPYAWLQAKGFAPRLTQNPSEPGQSSREDPIDVDAIEDAESDSDVECIGHVRVVTETITTTRTYTVNVPTNERVKPVAKMEGNATKEEAKPSIISSDTATSHSDLLQRQAPSTPARSKDERPGSVVLKQSCSPPPLPLK